ncbi:hypothetical protein EV121DRAFT_210862 [Schizophyllum commune]
MTETVSLSHLLINIAPPGGACEVCLGKPSEAVPLQRCSSCRAKFYCSSKCQRKDWKTHKMDCSPLTLPLVPTIPKRSPEMIAEVKKVANLLKRVYDACKVSEESALLKELCGMHSLARHYNGLTAFDAEYRLPDAFSWKTSLLDTKPPLERLAYTLARFLWIETVASLQTEIIRWEWISSLRESSFPSHYPQIVAWKVVARPGELSPGEYKRLAVTANMKTPEWLPRWASDGYKEMQAHASFVDLGEEYVLRWRHLMYVYELAGVNL